MELPHGFGRESLDMFFIFENRYMDLKKASLVWAKRLQTSLQYHGFNDLISDPCIYFKTTAAGLILIEIYVDDLLVAAKDENAVAEIKNMLAQEYMITDLGIVERYLGIEIEQNPNDKSILLRQSAYIQQLLEKFGMENCSPKSHPCFETSN